MTITLELSAEEAAALRAVAEAAGGGSIETVMHGLVAQLSAQSRAEVPAEEEDSDAAAEKRQEQEEVEANIKRWHAEARAAE